MWWSILDGGKERHISLHIIWQITQLTVTVQSCLRPKNLQSVSTEHDHVGGNQRSKFTIGMAVFTKEQRRLTRQLIQTVTGFEVNTGGHCLC